MKHPKISSRSIINKVLRLIGRLNNDRYRSYYVFRYRSFMYLNLSEPLNLRRLLGRYDAEKMEIISQLLKPGMVFADVGASLGDYTFFAAHRVGSKGKVLSFEPAPENCRWIRKGIEKNGYRNIELMELALSDKDGEATLYLGALSGWHTLKSGLKERDRGAIPVRTRKLDSLGLQALHLVKIDVEGAEPEVIAGAAETLRRLKPTILIDFHPQFGVDVKALERLLSHIGYRRSNDRDSVNLFLPS